MRPATRPIAARPLTFSRRSSATARRSHSAYPICPASRAASPASARPRRKPASAASTAASISNSNVAGQTLGKWVADQVLARFAQKTDTQPPNVILAGSQSVSKTNITLTGQVVDNLSGAAGATVSIDGGAPAALGLDQTGHFSVT